VIDSDADFLRTDRRAAATGAISALESASESNRSIAES
jgi:hypothetical protein